MRVTLSTNKNIVFLPTNTEKSTLEIGSYLKSLKFAELTYCANNRMEVT
jgi:hypothetical protein